MKKLLVSVALLLAAGASAWAQNKSMLVYRNGSVVFSEETSAIDSVTFGELVRIEMVSVPGGTFQMGSTTGSGDEQPVHSVTLSDFKIGKYELTQKQWYDVMGSWPGNAPSSTFGAGDSYPMYNVSWDDIQTFLSTLNQKTGKHYRLPTEAEWEYAARGGQQTQNFTYSGSNTIGDVAWYSGNSGNSGMTTHPVGSKDPNELGIYDMSGNVWEWCSDWYDSYGSTAQTNPTGPSAGSRRVFRGGSWYDGAGFCSVSIRTSYTPAYRISYLGFRLVLVP